MLVEIDISIGKLNVYTAAAGINPRRVIPVVLDVGTNRETLLNDPFYLGNRHPRVRGDRYMEFVIPMSRTLHAVFLTRSCTGRTLVQALVEQS